jgi:5-formaminoimidazole-4-carboxamide-1-(beta)-D-ribofuranosyl 5'-monophosphate synthetase
MPIGRKHIQKIISAYDTKNITIGVLGSHSALELGMSAKAMGAKTLVIVQEGRDEIYSLDHCHLYDHVIKVRKFKDMLNHEVQEKLRELNTLFVPNRSFSVYVGYKGIENHFEVPIYGNRFMLRCEDRQDQKGQYFLLKKAGIHVPEEFKSPEEIDRLAIVKVQRADNPLERAFFYPSSPEEYYTQSEEYKKKGLINDKGLAEARIEEYVLGSRFNANFHRYALSNLYGDLDLVGLSDRRQVNLQGFLNLPAREQLKIDVPVTNEEIGHYGLTIRESKQPLLWTAAKKLIKVAEKEYPPGVIGLFGLQGAVAYDPNDKKKVEFIVFDLSPRIPGDPAIGPTSPEMRNLSLKHGIRIEDPLDLTVLEIQKASKDDRLKEIVT